MSDPTEQVIKLAQKCVGQIPVVVLGSGASAQYGIGGMDALKDHLLASIKPADANENGAWILFSTELAKTGDLEMALYNVRLPSALEAQVVSSTRDMVLRDDLTVFQNLVQGKVEFALSALLNYCCEQAPRIQVVTTNYDRIAEYACDVANATSIQVFAVAISKRFSRATISNLEAKSLRYSKCMVRWIGLLTSINL